LCCQYFGGAAASLAPKYLEAIETTKNKILTWQNKPILALFSSCSGGHTENFENCFSDLKNNRFPGQKLSYLQGVPEGQLSETKATTGSKDWLESLWLAKQIDTCDSWSTQFRWKLLFSANDLESHIHHTVVSELMSDPEYAPFIIPPKKEQFGHIQTLEVVRRGISGTAMTLVVKTSAGDWTFNKELVIRSIFKNCQPGLKRLKSAKVFFDHKIDRLGLLESLTVYGLGWGHGVGLQQTGAQGQALAGRNYVQILKHYYSGVLINEL
jgi:SpoIID/LytB domain protein